MKKQCLFLVAILLFSIAICGAVTASDANCSVVDSEISETINNETSFDANMDNSSLDCNENIFQSLEPDEGQGGFNSDPLTDYDDFSSTSAAYGIVNNRTIKVLIYNGQNTSLNSINGVIRDLNYANNNNSIPGVIFTYGTSSVINQSILSNYDLLVMPGGTSGRIYLSNVNGDVIRNFVSNGGGFLGICAGAYAASNRVYGSGIDYNGWGIAPNVNSRVVNYVGSLNLQITSAGQSLFNLQGSTNILHVNGPAMYARSGGSIISFATYADNSTGFRNHHAMLGDYYGKGRVALVGPHPELTAGAFRYIPQLIAWATAQNVKEPSQPGNDQLIFTGNTFTINQLADAGSRVSNFIQQNNRLPNFVSVSGVNVAMPDFLYLLSRATFNIDQGILGSLRHYRVNAPEGSRDELRSGNISITEYLNISKNIINLVESNSRVPAYVNSSLGNIGYESQIYLFSRILGFYHSHHRLPNNVSLSAWTGTKLPNPANPTPIRTEELIESTSPANNAKNVPTNSSIQLTFKQPIQEGSGWIRLRDMDRLEDVPIEISIQNNRLILKPQSNLRPGTSYRIIIHTHSLKDNSGNSLSLWESYFTTEDSPAEGLIPEVVRVVPAIGTLGVPLDATIRVTFDQNIEWGSRWIRLRDADSLEDVPIELSIRGNDLIIKPLSNLKTATNYRIIIHTNSIMSLDGNPVSLWTSNFRTRSFSS